MSQRVKKPGRSADDSQGKRRRRRLSGSDADEDGTRSGSNSGGNGSLTGMWTPRHLNDLKVSSIYNRNSAEAPAELYRKDLISAMKLPDSEPLTPEEYWLITDSWKQEWEKGVQVPVNPESLPEPEVKLIQPVADRSHDFRLPKKKYVRVTHDDFFNPDYHQLVSTAARAEKVCSYDLDDVDAAWLGCSNADRAMQNTTLISEFLMEQVIEELELQCWEQVQTILKSQEGLGIEYDENVICDVCRSPESEEGNEMVFCDSCNICVHQACYGITTIPSGSWLCKTCTLGIKPACVLCPNLGGAMKATRSGHTWAHVACAIWIPEVSIGSVEKMEPITKISSIPQSRWSLVCVLCKEKTGACIQCSVKTCKTAYHVTCAFKNGLEMKPIIVDENAEDGIKLRSYCQKHSVNTKKDKSHSGSEEDVEKKKLKAMTAEERNQARAEKLQQIEAEFYKYVRLKDVSQNLAVDMDIVILIYNYWKLKRKSLNNRPLVPPRPETTQLLTQQQEQDLEQMKMFVQLRQDLERVRNLCYMVSRREKLSRSFFRLREQTFQKQLALLTEENDLSPEECQAILSANHGPSIYDQFYSHHSSTSASTSSSIPSTGHKSSLSDYETLISLIAGVDAKKDLVNGVIKSNKRHNKLSAAAGLSSTSSSADVVNSALSNSTNNTNSSNISGVANSVVNSNSDKSGANPYKKQFVNGARRRNLLGSGSSHSESECEQTDKLTTGDTPVGVKTNKKKVLSTPPANSGKGTQSKGNRKPLSFLFDSDSSVENDTPLVSTSGTAASNKKGNNKTAKGKVRGKTPVGKSIKGVKSTSYLSDSDELELPMVRGSSRTGASASASGTMKDNVPIYSDSDESATEDSKPVAVAPLSAPKKDEKVPKTGIKEKGTKKSKTAVASSLPNLSDIRQNKQQSNETTSSPEAKLKRSGKEKGGSTTISTTAPKNKSKTAGSKKGRNKSGFDPTELIVPQREAAKKATESIRSVKQKTKEQQQTNVENAENAAGGLISASKEDITKEPKGKTIPKTIVSSLSDSDSEEKAVKQPRKPKSPERKQGSGKGSRKVGAIPQMSPISANEDETGDLDKDEFDFDEDKDGGRTEKNVSYVPQRQAAKKAAEHIRSGLSNIVAARLIIEDEMELARKKTKLEKGQAGGKGAPDRAEEEESRIPSADSSKIESAVAEAAKKVTTKDRALSKGPAKVGKGGKKDPTSLSHAEQYSSLAGTNAKAATAAAGKEARGALDTSDWPFLDKGSQSACRRSRERSTSSSSGSSGSSSSGSSCSSRSSSASSSRSSSAESASPEPRSPVVTKKASNEQQQSIISSVINKLSSSSKDTGPGRKLKTSERCPNNRTKLRAETSQREKPTAKGGRSAKSGPGRGDPFRSAFSPSPEPETKPSGPTPERQREQKSSSPAHHDKVSPLSKTNEQQQRQKQRVNKSKSQPSSASTPVSKTITSEAKGNRRKGESSATKIAQAEKDSKSEAAASEKRSSTKAALANRKSPMKHTGPCLSSESEAETAPDPHQSTSKPDISSKARNNSRSQLPTESTVSPSFRKRKSNSEGGGSLGLSDSDESGAEEKENSCVSTAPVEHHQRDTDLHHNSSTPSTKTQQKNSTVTVPHSASILSPLTPTENKEKEQPSHGTLPRLSESEQPESKRPRLDSPTTVPSTSSGQLKSIFSPPGSTGGGRDGEILDFDSELYDLARSVVTDEYTHGDEIHSGGSLSFSFSQELFSREDNKEDSARATLNLVEKLRLQHARKSGGPHRPSTESSSDVPCDSLLEEIPGRSPSRPDSSLQEEKVDISGSSVEATITLEIREDDKSTNSQQASASTFEPPPDVKSPSNLLHTLGSPDITKQSIQGDERWVPPSTTSGQSSRNAPSHKASPSESIPTAAAAALLSPRTPSFTGIPEQSPPVPKQPLVPGNTNQQQSQHHRASVEGGIELDKHRIHSPTAYQEMISPRIRPHGSQSSTSADENSEKSNALSVDTHLTSPAVTSPIISPLLPGLNQGIPTFPGGTAAAAAAAAMAASLAAAETSPNLAAAAAGLPFGANHPFMYPALANNPAFASVVNSLAPFLQVPIPKNSPAVLGPVSPVNFPSAPNAVPFPPFISSSTSNLQAQQQQANMPGGQGQSGPGTVRTPTPSPTSGGLGKQQRRPSDVVPMVEGKLRLNSPLVSVAASMPPLAKPPLTSPSVLLQLGGVKRMTPPVMSNMAHIIESVVNNHRSDTGLPKTTLSLDMHMPSTTAPAVAPTSTNPVIKTPVTSPAVTATTAKHQGHIAEPGMNAVLSNKTTENIITGRDISEECANLENTNIVPNSIVNNAASPKQLPPSGGGRGRRASAQRTATSAKAAEKLSGVNAVIEDMMMSPQPKTKSGRKAAAQSPGRGKGPSRRGRGKGKGKNVVGVRKDLKGTVYDIDFDEFEENSEEKIDLRALRERRKSSEVHSTKEAEGKHSSKHSSSDHPHSGPILLTLSVPHGEKHYRPRSSVHAEKEGKEHKSRDYQRKEKKEKEKEKEFAQQQQQQQPTVPPISIKVDSSTKLLTSSSSTANGAAKGTPNDKGIHSILQAPLPGPVDMRTYSASASDPTGEESIIGKMGFPPSLAAKDPSSDIALFFMGNAVASGGAGTSSTVNELEELDKALEVLVSAPKPIPAGNTSSHVSTSLSCSVSSGSLVAGANQQTPAPYESAVKDVISNDTSNNSHANKLQNNTHQPSVVVNNILPSAVGVSFEQIASKQLDILGRDAADALGAAPPVPPLSSTDNNSDLSRNQLKVKIKGPFLDANYSSTNSIPPGIVQGSSHHLHPHGATSSIMPGHQHLAAASVAGYPPPTHSGSYGGPETGPYPSHHQHHPHQQWMMSSMMGNNTSNLRRMRKKELLRQYWTQDMNMDGGSNLPGFPPGAVGSGGISDISALPPNQGSHPHHPISRSVITIPKAVASMSIIPSKEDYRLEEESNDSNPGSAMGDMWSGGPGFGAANPGSKGNLGGKTEGTQKKRRSRGIYREMAALGILPPDAQGKTSRRERAAASGGNSGGNTPDSNSRKRIRNNNKPSRSTFIPPTLAESVDCTGEKGSSGHNDTTSNTSGGQSNSTSVSAALVNVANHPTPKLKIKFGDLSNSTSGSGSNAQPSTSSSSLPNNTNHMSDSDKEAPNKKAKGRPPKKRGIPDAAPVSAPSSSGGFSMEVFKRESMKYREMIMKDYAKAEQQEILKLSGTRRSKKHKRKAGASAAGSETDDGSVRSKSPEVKVITDGPKPKLILRFGKSRAGASTTVASGDNGGNSGSGVNSGGDDPSSGKINENGLPAVKDESSTQGSKSTGNLDGKGNDSTGKVNDLLRNNPQNGSKETANNNNNGSNGDKILVLELENKTADKLASLSSSSSTSGNQPQQQNTTGKSKNNVPSESSSSSSSTNATVPIRLKLSRCYEGYSLKNKDGLDVGMVDRENGGASNAAKQSDSCQVR